MASLVLVNKLFSEKLIVLCGGCSCNLSLGILGVVCVEICPNVMKRNGKDFCPTSTHSDILTSCLAEVKGPHGQTYIESFSDLIPHEK